MSPKTSSTWSRAGTSDTRSASRTRPRVRAARPGAPRGSRPQPPPNRSTRLRRPDAMAQDTVAVILGGGRGSRLYPLTKQRAKPAVPLAGNYRLIDIPISNCIHSGIHRIFVLTQFLSSSLHRHISETYKFDIFGHGFVQLLPAEQTLTSTDWYQGTADAVRRQMERLAELRPRDV